MSFGKGNIVWVDGETDGLNYGPGGHLLEIAVLVTDAELNILDEEGFHAVVSYTIAESQAMFDAAVPFVQEMHTETGLWDKLWSPEAMPLTAIDWQLPLYLRQFGDPRTMPVAGNSVRLDMNFMDRHLPKTANFLDYHMRDVSTVAGLASDWYDLPWFEKHNDHTAMVDIRESIRELKHYREAIFRPVSETTRDDVIRVLAENGLSPTASELHGWRCQYPDRYGDCTCIEELADDLMKLIRP